MADTLYPAFRRWLNQNAIVQIFRKIKSSGKTPKYSVIQSEHKHERKKSVIYLCPATDIPQGGVKVIYKQAALINDSKDYLTASVLHPFKPEFSCTWFAHSAPIKNNLAFDPYHDFVMIPEFWAVPHAKLLHNIGVSYGIFVQGGYIMALKGNHYGKEHDAAYINASLILAISDDTVECIKMAYPECSDRIYRVHCSVNPEQFIASTNKENVICYMPRRLKTHSQLVTFFLNKMIPPHWRIEVIEGMDENGVAATLGRSRIFLSFGELEGFSLPPVEAALSGCHVIGYTGEGAKEYWDPEIFTEIYSGDIKAFVKAVLNKIYELDNTTTDSHISSIRNLAGRYSEQIELADMRFLSHKIVEIMKSAQHKE